MAFAASTAQIFRHNTRRKCQVGTTKHLETHLTASNSLSRYHSPDTAHNGVLLQAQASIVRLFCLIQKTMSGAHESNWSRSGEHTSRPSSLPSCRNVPSAAL